MTTDTNTVSFVAFAIAAVVLAITPGPGIAYVVARTVAGGRSEGLASCFGTGIGGMLHVLAAALGLSVLVAQSALAFNLALYFFYEHHWLGLGLNVPQIDGTMKPLVGGLEAAKLFFAGYVVEK